MRPHVARTERRGAPSHYGRRAGEISAPSASGVFAAAVEHHRAGRLTEAVKLYGRVLAIDGRHADCLHLLGVAAHEMGRDDLALSMIGEAIAVNPRVAAYRCSMGNALGALGRLEDAAGSYRAALDIKPDEVEAHNNLGNALAALGQFDEASASYRRAIELRPELAEARYNLANMLKRRGLLGEAAENYRAAARRKPDYADAHYNLAIVLQDMGQLDDAAASYRRAIELRPGAPEARNNLGNALKQQGRLGEAIACYRETARLCPEYPEAHNNLGNALREQGFPEEAAACCRRAVELRPSFAEAHYNLGIALSDGGRFDEAEASFRAALALRPEYPEASNNLGLALKDQRRLEEAIACFRAAIALKPELAEAHNNLGIALGELGFNDLAIPSYRRALDLKPDFPEVHKNLGMALMAQGDLAEGFAEYEWRWRTAQLKDARRDFAQPQWRGEAAVGKTLLIHAEQGFGDTLQFCRYATLAAGRGLRVTIEAQKPLVRLLGGLAGVERVVARGEDLPDFDLHCPMLSMPLAMGTTLATVPGAGAYLHADAAQVAAWRARLAGMGGEKLRVGLVWAGNPRAHLPVMAAVDRRRSLAPERLAPLFAVPGVHFISLQKDGPPPPEGMAPTDVMAGMDDFADTAALIANLDLVISVDTAVAHLAAALGKPVWLLERFDSCWRWLSGRRDTPWYPSMSLYRQPREGDWAPVISAVVRDLDALARG